MVTAVIPRNPLEAAARAFEGDMLAVMCFALLFGVALGALRSTRTAPVVAVLEGLFDVSIWLVGFALRLAPVGVACLVFSLAARLGLNIFEVLGAYVLTVLLGLAIQQFGVYPLLLRTACGWNPVDFFRRIRPVMVTAFSTSSSNATLPTTLEVARSGLGIPARIGNFVLTLGSTFNQNGTALFEGVTVIFLAQCYGVELGLEKQLQVVGMSIAAGIGTAGVPGGSLPLVVLVLVSVGVPGEAIGIIIGVDRLLDMCRTVLNVTGDMVAAAFVSRGEPAEADPRG
jgi:DAACS family dicarboxylate/amino acid:cation (Na+ or H+) symporter